MLHPQSDISMMHAARCIHEASDLPYSMVLLRHFQNKLILEKNVGILIA